MPNPYETADQAIADGGLNEEFEQCAICGATLPKHEWCPTITDTDAEGNLVIWAFCDQDCKNAWTDR